MLAYFAARMCAGVLTRGALTPVQPRSDLKRMRLCIYKPMMRTKALRSLMLMRGRAERFYDI